MENTEITPETILLEELVAKRKLLYLRLVSYKDSIEQNKLKKELQQLDKAILMQNNNEAYGYDEF